LIFLVPSFAPFKPCDEHFDRHHIVIIFLVRHTGMDSEDRAIILRRIATWQRLFPALQRAGAGSCD
jgi:hypothetical protein